MENVEIKFRGYWELYKSSEVSSQRGSGTLGKYIVTAQCKSAFLFRVLFETTLLEIEWTNGISQLQSERVKLKTPEGNTLDGLSLFSQIGSSSWALILNDTSQLYESEAYEDHFFCLYNGLNVIRVNYRGTGKSTGSLKTSRDLIVDAETIYRFILSKGVKEGNILVSGRGLGAIVAVRLRHLFPGGPIFLDDCPIKITSKVSTIISNQLEWNLSVKREDLDAINSGKVIISRNHNVPSYSFYDQLKQEGFFSGKGRTVSEEGYTLNYFKERSLFLMELDLKRKVHWLYHPNAAKVLVTSIIEFSSALSK